MLAANEAGLWPYASFHESELDRAFPQLLHVFHTSPGRDLLPPLTPAACYPSPLPLANNIVSEFCI